MKIYIIYIYILTSLVPSEFTNRAALFILQGS